MKLCIIGNGLVSLTLANVLIKKNLCVDIVSNRNNQKYDKSRTLGISKSNIDYFNNEIFNINKISWFINNIKIYSENLAKNEILDFDNNGEQIFSIIKNYKLYEILNKNLKKSKYIKFKYGINYKKINFKNYKLVINCDPNHFVCRKFFSKKLKKNYNSIAYTTTIKHKKINRNKTAVQTFTNKGPIAFLPISNKETSVVYSYRINNDGNKIRIKDLIKKYNPYYSIIKIEDCSKFELKSSNLRNYYVNNILAFGDILHTIHPLAGQGFNMSLRDIQNLSKIIDEKISVGLDLDSSICSEFQNRTKDKNFIFSTGIDWIYELFNFESNTNLGFISRSIKEVGKNKLINSFFKKLANTGLRI